MAGVTRDEEWARGPEMVEKSCLRCLGGGEDSFDAPRRGMMVECASLGLSSIFWRLE